MRCHGPDGLEEGQRVREDARLWAAPIFGLMIPPPSDHVCFRSVRSIIGPATSHESSHTPQLITTLPPASDRCRPWPTCWTLRSTLRHHVTNHRLLDRALVQIHPTDLAFHVSRGPATPAPASSSLNTSSSFPTPTAASSKSEIFHAHSGPAIGVAHCHAGVSQVQWARIALRRRRDATTLRR